MSPEQYAKIVAKRPELVVRFHEPWMGQALYHTIKYFGGGHESGWLMEDNYGRSINTLTTGAALALIESHWLRMLPKGSQMVTRAIDGRFVIENENVRTGWHDNLLDALAEFYGGGT